MIRLFPACVLLLASWPLSAMAQQERPLGSPVTTLEARFNEAAKTLGLGVRLSMRPCDHLRELCDVAIDGRKMGHLSPVDGRDEIETVLLSHGCNDPDGASLGEAAVVFVNLFGGSTRPGMAEFSELSKAIRSSQPPRLVLIVDGIEFTQSGISCTLLVARPISKRAN